MPNPNPATTTAVAQPPARTHARGRRAVAPPVRARRDRLSRHDQGHAERRPVRRRAGRRVPRRPIGRAAPEPRRPRPLAPAVHARRRRAHPDAARRPSRLYLACRLTITLPARGGRRPDVDAVYEDIGEMDAGSFAGLKALYSDARKRAAVAAGIGAYLYTALAPVVLPIGPGDRQVQAIRRGQGKSDLLVDLARRPSSGCARATGAHEHRRGPPRPRRDPRPRRTRDRHGPGRGRREHRDHHARRNREPRAIAPDPAPAGPAASGQTGDW